MTYSNAGSTDFAHSTAGLDLHLLGCLGLLFQQTQAQVSHELRIVKEARLSNQSFLSTWRLLTMELRVLSYFGSLMSKQCVEAGGLVWRIK